MGVYNAYFYIQTYTIDYRAQTSRKTRAGWLDTLPMCSRT